MSSIQVFGQWTKSSVLEETWVQCKSKVRLWGWEIQRPIVRLLFPCWCPFWFTICVLYRVCLLLSTTVWIWCDFGIKHHNDMKKWKWESPIKRAFMFIWNALQVIRQWHVDTSLQEQPHRQQNRKDAPWMRINQRLKLRWLQSRNAHR